MSRVKIGRRVYLTEDGKRTVGEDDPAPKVLLCSESGEVDRADAERYGLLDAPTPEGEADPPEEDGERAEEAPKVQGAGSKAGRRPANKSRRPAANKTEDKTSDT